MVWHLWYVDNELYCYNAEGDKNSVFSQASCIIGWKFLELQGKTDIEKRTIDKILGEELELRKITSCGCRTHSLK